ncbi:unnamed protein product [Schistosoma curassoni]|uniref:Ricin B-type lectin domain-containing protein n=1 Tax=Schistosoma curassoni TaxID=6186 RepID=A0A183JXW5_9TREM|nr:unnamed protein product [Schistosoma curassoni]
MSLIGICEYCMYCLDITLIHEHSKQRWIVASSGIQDARFVLFGTRQLDVSASQSRCSLWDSNPVPFASSVYKACDLRQYLGSPHIMHVCQQETDQLSPTQQWETTSK